MKRTTLVIGVVALLAVAATPAVVASAPVRFEPPSPTGPHKIGTVALHLVGKSRTDPWVAGNKRELMISIWYPARKTAGYPVAPWMPNAAADRYLHTLGVPPGKLVPGATDGHLGAPADRRLGKLPVLLYSPGANASRSYGTGVAEELANRGYVVVTMDHTYDAAVVEFPRRPSAKLIRPTARGRTAPAR